MIIPVLVRTEKDVIPPTSNGFPVIAKFVWKQADVWHADTGVDLQLPPGLSLEIEPNAGVFVLAWSISGLTTSPPESIELPKGRLAVAVSGAVKLGEPFARVWVVNRHVAPVRFMQRDESGARVIRGDAQIAVSTESGKPKL